MKVFLILIFFITYAFSCDNGLLPHNRFKISKFRRTGITEAQFKEAIKKFEKAFEDKLWRELDKELIVYHSWASSTVNAYADQKPKKYEITIFGGVARFPGMTQDAFSTVLCHELGHHLGGEPRKNANKWSSVEGQADYYAMMKCLRELWKNDDNVSIVKKLKLPTEVMRSCALAFKAKNKRALCMRSAYAGLKTARFLQKLEEESIPPEFHTPDPVEVPNTLLLWPSPQCRLDTYYEGSRCPVSKDIPFDSYSRKKGACNRKSKRVDFGTRPKCWYKP
jgi:hypothetical protein